MMPRSGDVAVAMLRSEMEARTHADPFAQFELALSDALCGGFDADKLQDAVASILLNHVLR